MSLYNCPICHEFRFLFGVHNCKLKFNVVIEDTNGGELSDRDFFAYDAEDAAKKSAEHYDSDGDYTIVQGNSDDLIFIVTDIDGEVTKFSVWGETVPTYYAKEINNG